MNEFCHRCTRSTLIFHFVQVLSKIPENRQWLGHRRREKKSAFVPFASFRYLRNNAKTPVSIKKKDITAATISSRSLLRKSGSINSSLRTGPPPICIADLRSTGQKTRSSNTLNSRPSMLANGRCRELGSLESHGD